MHVGKFLHKLLDNAIHQKQVSVLSEVVVSAIESKSLVLTKLGRGINNSCQERSNIRKVDRLLGNNKIIDKNIEIYRQVCLYLLSGVKRPLIIVDAVKIPRVDLYLLRACCTIGGRCHTLYEMPFPKADEGKSCMHKKFLSSLKDILPSECSPIIVTDAGFHNPWFKLVLSLGWDFVGRVRGLKIYCSSNERIYTKCNNLWAKATSKAQALGKVILSKRNPMHCYFYLYKKQLKGRTASKSRDYDMYSRSNREPWLLASSLGDEYQANEIIKMYAKRMKIEESFRDMKSQYYGLGLSQVVVRRQSRYGMLCLITMLANFVACFVGQIVESKKRHYEFQANSIKSRRVLSFFYLGCQALRKKFIINDDEIDRALKEAQVEFAASS